MSHMVEPSGNELTRLLSEWRGGNRESLELLAPIIYPELRRIAGSHLRREMGAPALSTTELVHELYVRLAGNSLPELENRVHFYGIAARVIRQILVDEARERRAQKRGSGLDVLPIDEMNDIAPHQSGDVLALHDALNELARTDERKARILELRYFSGLGGEEIATVMDVSTATVARELRVAKAWLKTYLS